MTKDVLSDEFLARLSGAFLQPLDFDMAQGEENVFVNKYLYDAAMAFHTIAPRLKELIEARKFIGPDGEPRLDYDGLWGEDYDFFTTAANLSAEIGRDLE